MLIHIKVYNSTIATLDSYNRGGVIDRTIIQVRLGIAL
jgi:hypothetical protein